MGLDGNAILLGNCITSSCIECLLLQKQACHEHDSSFLYTSLVCVYELARLKERTLHIECGVCSWSKLVLIMHAFATLMIFSFMHE